MLAPTVLFCDTPKGSPLALPLGELSAQLTERAVTLCSSSEPVGAAIGRPPVLFGCVFYKLSLYYVNQIM